MPSSTDTHKHEVGAGQTVGPSPNAVQGGRGEASLLGFRQAGARSGSTVRTGVGGDRGHRIYPFPSSFPGLKEVVVPAVPRETSQAAGSRPGQRVRLCAVVPQWTVPRSPSADGEMRCPCRAAPPGCFQVWLLVNSEPSHLCLSREPPRWLLAQPWLLARPRGPRRSQAKCLRTVVTDVLAGAADGSGAL